jgi:stage V sporulation protein B
MDRSKRAIGALYLSIASLIFMASGYLINIFLGRHLGPTAYGTYGVLTSLMTVLNIVQLTGPPQAVSKLVAERNKSTENVLASGLQVQLFVTITIAAIFILLAPVLAEIFNDSQFEGYIRAIALIFPFYGLFALYNGYYNGLQKFKIQAYMYALYSISKLIFVVVLALKFGIYGAIAGFVIAPVITLFLGFRFPRTKNTTYKRKIIFFSLPLIGFAVFTTLQLSIDIFSLKTLVANNKVIGYYVAAQNIALIPYIAMSSLGQVLFPSVSKFLGAGQMEDARQIIGNSLRYLLLLLLPMATALYATAPSLIHLLFGTKYLPAAEPLRILLVGYVLLTIFTMLANVLNGAGRAKSSMIIAACGVLVGFLGCIILIPHYGANGAAFGTLIGAIISAKLSILLTYKIFKFQFSYSSLFKAIVASALILAMGLLIPIPIYLLPVVYILFGMIYVLALHLMGEFTLEDRAHIKNLLPGWMPFTRFI